MAVDQEIRVLGDENIIANPKNSQKSYPLTFKAQTNVIVYGRKKENLNFTVPISSEVNYNFNLERNTIIFSDNFNLEEYSYILVKNPFEDISDFFQISSLEELSPDGEEFNKFNDEVVKWLRRITEILSDRCMIFETTLFKDINNFPNIPVGHVFIRAKDGWTSTTITDADKSLKKLISEYTELMKKEITKHVTVTEIPRITDHADKEIERIIVQGNEEIGLIQDFTDEKKVEITQHTDKEINRINLTGIGNKLSKADTIAELKAMNLKLNDVVEVLGYYSKDDGATHKRVIANEDDGSGVQLANGLWANIVHNGEVNVDWFGAKGDGVTDDTQTIQKAINLKKDIIFDNKIYYLTSTIDFRKIRHIIGNRARLIFGNPNSLKYNCVLICSSNILENIDLIIKDDNDGILLYFFEDEKGDGKDYIKQYPSQAVIRNIYLDSDNSRNAGILMQFSSYSNYGSVFENIRCGRGTSEYTRKVRSGFVFDVNVVDGWATGNLFKDIILDCFVSDYVIKLQGNIKDQSYAGNNTFQNIQIQTKDTNYPYLCALKVSYMSRAKFINFKLWDYVKGASTSGKPIQVDHSANIKCISSDITNYVTELVENVGGENYNSFRYAEYEIQFEPKNKEYTGENKAIPIFLPDVFQTYSVSSLEILPLRNFSQDSLEGYLKVFGRTTAMNVNTTSFFITYISTKSSPFLKKIIMYKEGIVVWVKDIIRSERLIAGYNDGIIGKELTRFDGSKETINIEEFENPITLQINNIKMITEKLDYNDNTTDVVKKLDTPHYARLMTKEGCLDEFDNYLLEKQAYDKQQENLERDKQVAYEEELKTNPNLTYEEFISSYSETDRMMLPEMEEPEPSEKLKAFMEKWL